MLVRNLAKFRRDASGAVLVEAAVAIPTLLLLIFAIIEFSYVFYQWNSATKAAQWGARIAAVSDPVASNLVTLTGLEPGNNLPGDPMPSFDCTCRGATAVCTGTVPQNAIACTYSALAMNRIFLGRGNNGSDCVTGANTGICGFLPNLTVSNVVVRYQYTGLGLAGRPAGPVPTITVSFEGLNYSFLVIGGLVGLTSLSLPNTAMVSVTGEDLKQSWVAN